MLLNSFAKLSHEIQNNFFIHGWFLASASCPSIIYFLVGQENVIKKFCRFSNWVELMVIKLPADQIFIFQWYFAMFLRFFLPWNSTVIVCSLSFTVQLDEKCSRDIRRFIQTGHRPCPEWLLPRSRRCPNRKMLTHRMKMTYWTGRKRRRRRRRKRQLQAVPSKKKTGGKWPRMRMSMILMWRPLTRNRETFFPRRVGPDRAG